MVGFVSRARRLAADCAVPVIERQQSMWVKAEHRHSLVLAQPPAQSSAKRPAAG